MHLLFDLWTNWTVGDILGKKCTESCADRIRREENKGTF